MGLRWEKGLIAKKSAFDCSIHVVKRPSQKIEFCTVALKSLKGAQIEIK